MGPVLAVAWVIASKKLEINIVRFKKVGLSLLQKKNVFQDQNLYYLVWNERVLWVKSYDLHRFSANYV